SHATRIFTDRHYNVDAAVAGTVGLRVSFIGVDLSELQLRYFPDAVDVSDWHINRWSGGVQLGVCTADNMSAPPARVNTAMGAHLSNSAAMLIYANPAPDQGGDSWWAPGSPGAPWDETRPNETGYDVRTNHGRVVNYAGKGLYVFPGAPATDPYEGNIVFTGEYDGYASNYWYRKDAITPHTDWTRSKPTAEQIRAVNTFDAIIEITPIAVTKHDKFKRYKFEWWLRKYQSSAKLEGGPAHWIADKNDPQGGWVQPKLRYWYFGGRATDGTRTGVDEPGFDFSAVFPYVSAFGWWRKDQPQQIVRVQRIIIEYVATRPEP
ncbi:MAG: hypothetical protein R3330_15385, partial [Saprospiraceae bacterium]|nr:hypothetical protein [Saprospiraceae bacterium]